jgi:hypothetical protein
MILPFSFIHGQSREVTAEKNRAEKEGRICFPWDSNPEGTGRRSRNQKKPLTFSRKLEVNRESFLTEIQDIEHL